MRIVVLEAGDVNREIRALFRFQSRLDAIHPHTYIHASRIFNVKSRYHSNKKMYMFLPRSVRYPGNKVSFILCGGCKSATLYVLSIHANHDSLSPPPLFFFLVSQTDSASLHHTLLFFFYSLIHSTLSATVCEKEPRPECVPSSFLSSCCSLAFAVHNSSQSHLCCLYSLSTVIPVSPCRHRPRAWTRIVSA